MSDKVRVRFAPSPTGGLHLGGVRTVLYNYLFARQHGGTFILRIEDTDQSRFVPGAEQYILDCLKWCGLEPDESPVHGGNYGPYRQSERKDAYRAYAEQLVAQGDAYYAFDSSNELESMRTKIPNFQYNHSTRGTLNNSLNLPPEKVQELLTAGTPYTIRIKMPADETISFTDMIRGLVEFSSAQTDDKVLLKADGMPTYHLAVVVDDYLMKITHAFRGEEWLPSAPVHILLWKQLFGLEQMPQWAHLPLILKPDGNGKLSKRDGDRLGFPVFAMNWKDPATGDVTRGFRELGFLPQAFINMLAMLGWNNGTVQEIFTLSQLVEQFSMDRVHKGGAKFDFDKAKWFNHKWIEKTDGLSLSHLIKQQLVANNIRSWSTENTVADVDVNSNDYLLHAVQLVRSRLALISDFWPQAHFLFEASNDYASQPDFIGVKNKWNEQKKLFFAELVRQLQLLQFWESASLEKEFKELAAANTIKPGDVLLPLRIMLVGGKYGPGVFDIAQLIGRAETIARIRRALQLLE